MSAPPHQPLTVAQALREAAEAGLPRLDAQWWLCHVLSQDRSWLIRHDDQALSDAQRACWLDGVARRLDGVPMAYLTGQHGFHGLDLHVNAAVLDPRPDTETLVDWALDRLTQNLRDQTGCAPRVLDLGTGSGAIALAIRHGCMAAQVSAVDRSAAALAVAQANGERLGLPVQWHHGSWFEPVATDRFDLIVSNPPYIADADPHLPALRHEPREALVSGLDGLDDLRQIIRQAPAHLQPGGWLLLEHGHDQGPAVQALLAQVGFDAINLRRDLAGHHRCSGGRWPPNAD